MWFRDNQRARRPAVDGYHCSHALTSAATAEVAGCHSDVLRLRMHQKYSTPATVMVERARLLLIGATLFWGLTFPLVRGFELAQLAHVPGIPAPMLVSVDVAMRFGLAALVLLPLCLRHLLNITRREWIQATGLAFLAGIGLYLQTLGLAWADASVVGFLTQLYTLIVPLIVALRDRRWPTVRVVGACVLVLNGAALLSPQFSEPPRAWAGRDRHDPECRFLRRADRLGRAADLC